VEPAEAKCSLAICWSTVKFTNRVVDLKRQKVKLALKPEVLKGALFQELWTRISPRTTYELNFETGAVVSEAVRRIDAIPDIEPMKYRIEKSELEMDKSGLAAAGSDDRGSVEVSGATKLPDVVGQLCRRIPLSRVTIVQILNTCNKLGQVKENPSIFIDRVAQAVTEALYQQTAEGIIYRPLECESWAASLA
jgi:type III restriction enzyme